MQVTLSAEWARFVSDQVAGGRFPSAEQVVQASLEELKRSVQRRAEMLNSIREKVRQGCAELESGDFEEFDDKQHDEFFAELIGGISTKSDKHQ